MPLTALVRDRLLIDRSIALAVALRTWQLMGGAVSLWIVARFFTLELQGFYYSFSSLLRIQMFFDLGLTGVLTYVASHEWAAARDPAGEQAARARQRLGELVLRTQRWYGLCALAFGITAAGVGYLFFAPKPGGVTWLTPWLVAVLFTSLSLWLTPLVGILEGCNHIATVNAYRLAQAVLGHVAVWSIIVLGGGLWAVVLSAAVQFFVELVLVRHRFGSFFASLRTAYSDPPLLSWKEELLPLQWRIAAQSVAYWFAMQAYTPIIFHYHGPETAGQMGMTWAAITTIYLAACAWVQTRIPEMGRLISQRQMAQSRHFLRRIMIVSLLVYTLASAAFLLLVVLLRTYVPSLGSRVLDPGTVLLFLCGAGLSLIPYALSVYVRAHKIDPFLRINVTTSLIMAGLVWWLGAELGPIGAAIAYTGVTALLAVPASIIIYRRTTRAYAPHEP